MTSCAINDHSPILSASMASLLIKWCYLVLWEFVNGINVQGLFVESWMSNHYREQSCFCIGSMNRYRLPVLLFKRGALMFYLTPLTSHSRATCSISQIYITVLLFRKRSMMFYLADLHLIVEQRVLSRRSTLPYSSFIGAWCSISQIYIWWSSNVFYLRADSAITVLLFR